MIYKSDGTKIYPSALDDFSQNSTLEYHFDDDTDTAYYLYRIFKTKKDGTKQYPFVFAPNGGGTSINSVLQMNSKYKFPFAMNAGVGATSGGGYSSLGIIIENKKLLQQGYHENLYQLTIDSKGDLGYSDPNTSGNELINNGIVSALCGFCPIVINHVSVESSFYNWITHYNQAAQRQVIGQFENGDYAVLSCEGRDFDNSVGFTIPQLITICLKHNIKFAFNLDGGGSVETVNGDRQVNIIYENTYGRYVPNYIVFNGTNKFVKSM